MEGVAYSFDKVVVQMTESNKKGEKDYSELLGKLDPKQCKALELFGQCEVVTAKQIAELFGFQSRTCAALCKKWVEIGFLEIVDFSNKARRYRLSKKYNLMVSEGPP